MYRRLAVLGLVVLLLVPALLATGQAMKRLLRANPVASTIDTFSAVAPQVFAEEEIHAVVEHDLVVLSLAPAATERWVVEHRPPAPVHLEREGRPPSV